MGHDLKIRKGSLLAEVQVLYLKADTSGLSPEEWALHYNLEDELLEIYRTKEEYWHRRGSMNWVLFGDANTAYLQAIANCRRRQCTIPFLWEGDRLIQDPKEVREHVDGFYKSLFAAWQRSGTTVAGPVWEESKRVSIEKNNMLLEEFSDEEVANIIKGMNPSSPPGLDGLPLWFFQVFW